LLSVACFLPPPPAHEWSPRDIMTRGKKGLGHHYPPPFPPLCLPYSAPAAMRVCENC
jgi:hypothetical protein